MDEAGKGTIMKNGTERYRHIEVSGDAIISVTRGIEAEALCRILLKKYDLQDVKRGQFYSLANYLALLEEIETRMPAVAKKIGEAMCNELVLPPSIATFDQFTKLHDKIYNMNIRGNQTGEVGSYRYTKEPDGNYHATVNTPFSCAFTQASILGFAKKLGQSISISHRDSQCRSKGDPQCNYLLRTR